VHAPGEASASAARGFVVRDRRRAAVDPRSRLSPAAGGLYHEARLDIAKLKRAYDG
jgi:hypothetical protein